MLETTSRFRPSAYLSSRAESSTRKKTTVTICHEVLCFPRRSAGRIWPRALAIRRNPVIRKSRATTIVATQAGTAPSGTSEINAAAIIILSTSGSISFPKFVTDPVAARDFAVEIIGDPGQDKDDQRRGAGVDPDRIERRDKKNGQDQPADGETICPVHARTARIVSSLKTGCFQIGTVCFSSSMIHWLALKAAARCALATRTTIDASASRHKADPMMNDDFARAKLGRARFRDQASHLMLRHRPMRFVFDPGNFPSILERPHNSPKIDRGARRRIFSRAGNSSGDWVIETSQTEIAICC